MTATPPAPLRLILATDTVLHGDGLASLLASVQEIDVVARASDQESLARAVAEFDPDAVVISTRTDVVSMVSGTLSDRRLRDDHPALPMVMICEAGNGFAIDVLRGGAARVAYLVEARLSGIEAVVRALRDVTDGGTVLDPTLVDALVRRQEGGLVHALTHREVEVLTRMADGLSNRAIALALRVTHRAVENHVSSIYRKLDLMNAPGVDQRVSAALAYQRIASERFTS